MAYPEAHWLLAIGGSLPGGEQWTTTLRIKGTHPETQLLTQLACDAYALAIDTWWVDNDITSGGATLGWVKLNWVGTDGKYVDAWTNRVDYVPEHQGSSTTTVGLPNQVAMVVTLRTVVARGHAHAGRMYFPIPNFLVSDQGVLDPTQQATAKDQATELIQAILNVTIVTGAPFVYSKIGVGAGHQVTRVGVGRVLDTMRSRRTSITEDYLYGVLTVP